MVFSDLPTFFRPENDSSVSGQGSKNLRIEFLGSENQFGTGISICDIFDVIVARVSHVIILMKFGNGVVSRHALQNCIGL